MITDFENNLSEILNGIEIKKQFKLLNYEFDFYLPEFNVVILYDKQIDEIKQQKIFNKFNCDFITIKKGDENKGLNELFLLIMYSILYEFVPNEFEMNKYDNFYLKINKIVSNFSYKSKVFNAFADRMNKIFT